MTNYPCLYPDCYRMSEYFAIDNRAKYGHVCRSHYQLLNKEEYSKLDQSMLEIDRLEELDRKNRKW